MSMGHRLAAGPVVHARSLTNSCSLIKSVPNYSILKEIWGISSKYTHSRAIGDFSGCWLYNTVKGIQGPLSQHKKKKIGSSCHFMRATFSKNEY